MYLAGQSTEQLGIQLCFSIFAYIQIKNTLRIRQVCPSVCFYALTFSPTAESVWTKFGGIYARYPYELAIRSFNFTLSNLIPLVIYTTFFVADKDDSCLQSFLFCLNTNFLLMKIFFHVFTSSITYKNIENHLLKLLLLYFFWIFVAHLQTKRALCSPVSSLQTLNRSEPNLWGWFPRIRDLTILILYQTTHSPLGYQHRFFYGKSSIPAFNFLFFIFLFVCLTSPSFFWLEN